MQIVYDNLDWLKRAARIRSIQKRNTLIEAANSDQILAILECAINVLKGRAKFTSRQKQRLIAHADFLRKLARKRSERQTKRFIIQQGQGAVLPALLIPIISNIISSLIN